MGTMTTTPNTTSTSTPVPDAAVQIVAEITGRPHDQTVDLVPPVAAALRTGRIFTTPAARYRPADDRKTVLRVPVGIPPKVPFADTTLRDAVVSTLFGPVDEMTPADVAAYAHLTGDNWAGNQTARAVDEIDHALREIIDYATSALRDLHDHHHLPRMMIDGFSRFDSALRDLPKAENRLVAVVQTSTNAHHVAARAEAETVDVE